MRNDDWTRNINLAPSWGRGDMYPYAGERIGPMWQRVWLDLRNSRHWINATDLASSFAPHFQLERKTIYNVLSGAHKARFLERRYRIENKKRVVQYRMNHTRWWIKDSDDPAGC